MTRPNTVRLAAFACGDFAFNLYWQSVMLYLLFYYIDALAIGMELGAALYLAASVWDGVVSLAVGVIADRRGSARHYRSALLIGAMPLGIAFVIAYMAPPVAGVAGIAFVLGGHVLFRTAYALVNVPYLAMSARISADSRDRALVAGLRMLAGTGAAVVVPLGTVPVGTMLGGAGGPRAYLFAAMLFASVATVILLYVGATSRDAVLAKPAPPPSVQACLSSLARNRAFLTLAGAMMAMIVVAVPLWMLAARLMGARAAWFVATGACAVGLILFAVTGIATAHAMQWLLMGLQVAIVGLHFAFWASLPDTIEWGQRDTGLRVEGTVFGLAALLQRVAIGVATVILGWSFGSAGYTANVAQEAGTLAAMRATIAIAPLCFLALSAWLMWLNPMRKGAHDRIVADLSATFPAIRP